MEGTQVLCKQLQWEQLVSVATTFNTELLLGFEHLDSML